NGFRCLLIREVGRQPKLANLNSRFQTMTRLRRSFECRAQAGNTVHHQDREVQQAGVVMNASDSEGHWLRDRLLRYSSARRATVSPSGLKSNTSTESQPR